MKKTLIPLLVLFCLLSNLCSIAQGNQPIDSLKKILEAPAKRSDSVIIAVYLKIAEEYRNHSVDSSFKYAQIALDYSLDKNQYWAIGHCYRRLGFTYLYSSNYDSSIYFLKKALAQTESFPSAFDNTFKCTVLNALGGSKMRKTEYRQALHYFSESLKIAEGGVDKYIPLILNNMALLYTNLKEYGKSEELLFRLEKLDPDNVGQTWSNLADLYNRQEKYELAIKYALLSQEEFYRIGDRGTENYYNLGRAYNETGQFSEAIRYHNLARNMAIEYGDKFSEASATSGLAVAYRKLKKFDLSLINYTRAVELLLEIGDRKNTANTYTGLSLLHEEMGNLKEALKFQRMYSDLYDSLFNEEKIREIKQMELNFEAEKNERDLIIEKSRNEILEQKAVMLSQSRDIIILISLLIILTAFIIFKQSRHKRKLLITKLDLRNREITSKILQIHSTYKSLDLLKRQLNELEVETGDKALKGAKSLLSEMISTRGTWDTFRLHFEEINPDFFDKLERINPELTANEIKLCAYLKFKLSTKELARVLNVTPRTIQTARYRLKKSLNLGKDDDLVDFIRTL